MTAPGFGSLRSPRHQAQSPAPRPQPVVSPSPSRDRTTHRFGAKRACAQSAHQDPARSLPAGSASPKSVSAREVDSFLDRDYRSVTPLIKAIET